MEKDLEVFSEKLGRTIIISDNPDIDEKEIIFDDTVSSMSGWVHNGWNNDNGGAGW